MTTTRRLVPFFVLFVALFAALPLVAATPPRVSPTGTVSQVVGVSKVEIAYSRPSVRERVIYGELVPYGEVWRTGANEATTFTLEHDALVEGKPLAAGTYALFTIPGKESWTLVFSSQTDLWGAFGRDEAQDVLRVEVKPQAAPFLEMLTFTFPSVSSEGGASEATVRLHWAEVAVSFHVEFASDVLVGVARDEVSAALAGDNARAANPWIGFLLANELALADAEAWAAKLVGLEGHDYTGHAHYARLLAKNGKTAEAIEAAKAALALVPEDASSRTKDDAESLRAALAQWSGSH